MKRLLLLIFIALSVSSCVAVKYRSPGINLHHMNNCDRVRQNYVGY